MAVAHPGLRRCHGPAMVLFFNPFRVGSFATMRWAARAGR